MEEFGGCRLQGIGNTTRKKRSQTSRRPRPESLPFPESPGRSPLSSTPLPDDVSRASSDDSVGAGTDFRRKEFNLNQCASRCSASKADEFLHKKIKEDGSSSLANGNVCFGDSVDQGGSRLNQRRSKGFLAPANWKSTSKTMGVAELQPTSTDIYGGRNGDCKSSGNSRGNRDGVGNDNKVKKVKLKVGGVTHTIQTQSDSHGVAGNWSSVQSARTTDAHQTRHKLILQDNSGDERSPRDQNSGLQGLPWKDFSRGSSSRGKGDSSMGKMNEKNASRNPGDKSEPVRKSKRVPKRRILDDGFDEEGEDDEIRYLERLKISKVAAGNKEFEVQPGKKQRISKNSKHENNSEDFVSSRSSKDGKELRSERGENTDYEDEDLVSDGELEGKKGKKTRKDSIDSPTESKRELALTNRQRALLSSKEASPASGAGLIEFPNGLPPAPPRKQKEKLSEVEQQLKKAEAAQRRRMQVEKAARESEAEAIRKILGQDSSRKKREDKMKQRREELEQERAANALVLSSNTIRLVMGPAGTVVTFSEDIGLPSIFNPKPCSYPPPREKCAGPSCTNQYKYRDSKSKLPLCSLHCYKAINEKILAETIR